MTISTNSRLRVLLVLTAFCVVSECAPATLAQQTKDNLPERLRQVELQSLRDRLSRVEETLGRENALLKTQVAQLSSDRDAIAYEFRDLSGLFHKLTDF